MPTPTYTKSKQLILERILLYGGSGVGKSHSYLTVAKWCQRRRSNATFYVIQTPGNGSAYQMMMGPGGDFYDLENVHIEHVDTMDDYTEAAQMIRRKGTPEDWLAIDLLDDAWGAAQDEYARRRWGEDLSGYWITMDAIADDDDPDYPIKGWDYGRINGRYRTFAQTNMIRFPGHLMCMSTEDKLKPDSKSGKSGEKQDVKDLYGITGYKARGQKADGHRFNTVIRLGKSNKGEFRAQTANEKNKGREYFGVQMRNGFRMEPINDFFMDYLVKKAGWKL